VERWVSEVIARFFIGSDQSYFLFGPRGTGKSSWLTQHYPDALYIDLLNPDVLREYLAYPERLKMHVEGSASKRIIIDEIQKAPALLSVVHRLIEDKKGWQFILTGSSARKLKRSGVDLLAGRALLRHMHPFMAAELGQSFDLNNALQYGLVPLIVMSSSVKESLAAYLKLYIQEEIQAEGLVRNVGDFIRFLDVISFSHGAIVNISNIARECAVSRKLIEGYLGICQDLLISYHLPVFTVRAKRATIVHEKFYFFDVGIYRSLRQKGFLDSTSELNGPGLEGLVLQHLRAWNDYQGSPCKLHYWRTQHGVEVDFVIYGEKHFYAIEVKHANTIYHKDVKSLQAFCEDYPEATPILLYQGLTRLKIGPVLCMPVDAFLKALVPGSNLI
jgi:predicted AAA+ superfamily ATPase